MSVLIRNGRIVTAADSTVADVFVDGERVALIGSSLDVEADTVIAATQLPSGESVLAIPSPSRTGGAPSVARMNTA